MDMRAKKKPIARTDQSSCKQADSTGFYSRVFVTHYISFGNTINHNEEQIKMAKGIFVTVLETSKACPGAFGEVVDVLAPDVYLVALVNGNQFIVHASKLVRVSAD
jgi:hypothetical protein